MPTCPTCCTRLVQTDGPLVAATESLAPVLGRGARVVTKPTVVDILDERRRKAEQGPWVPACGGTEVPHRYRSGKVLLYCWQPSTGRHAYMDCGTDMMVDDATALAWIA